MNIYEKLFEVKKANILLQRDTKAFNYKYATLDQIQSKLWPGLEKQKLIIIHQIKENKVITKIINIENIEEILESEIEMSLNIKPQDKWSEITYYRRYNLLSLLDLEVSDDDWKKAQDSKVKTEKKDDEKKWYNDFDKQKNLMQQKLINWETTIEKVIADIKSKWFSISKETENKIREL